MELRPPEGCLSLIFSLAHETLHVPLANLFVSCGSRSEVAGSRMVIEVNKATAAYGSDSRHKVVKSCCYRDGYECQLNWSTGTRAIAPSTDTRHSLPIHFGHPRPESVRSVCGIPSLYLPWRLVCCQN